jgi:hypothetical protein
MAHPVFPRRSSLRAPYNVVPYSLRHDEYTLYGTVRTRDGALLQNPGQHTRSGTLDPRRACKATHAYLSPFWLGQ